MRIDPASLPPGRRAAIMDRASRDSLLAFVARAFHLRNPGAKFHMAPYIDAICHALERLYRGECRHLIITVPPRHGKSDIASVAFPAWALGQDPSLRLMVASYGLELSGDYVDKARSLVGMEAYRRMFPGVRIRKGRDKSHVFGTHAGGGYRALSVKGAVTGFGGDIIIVDDLHKADEALTPNGREEAKTFFTNTLGSRFDDPAGARMLVIQQRLHEDDIVGYLLAKGSWEHLNLPAEAERSDTIPLGRGQVWHRRKGDLLDPVRFPKFFLEERKLALGNRSYGAQYQNNPTVAEGGCFRSDHFGQYSEAPPREEFHRIVLAMDTASTDRSTSDYSVCMTWGYLPPHWYLLDVYRAKPEFPDLVARTVYLHRKWKADALTIEAASSGHALYQQVKRAGLPGMVISPPPRGSKLDRADAITAELSTGRYLLPEEAPWLDDLRHELLAFPDGRHDDQVDALVQFVEFVFDRPRWVATRIAPDGRPITPPRQPRRRRGY